MEWILANTDLLLKGGGALLVVVSVVAAITPTPKDDAVVERIKNLWDKLVGFLGKK